MSPNSTRKSPLRSPFSKLNNPSAFCCFLHALYSSPPTTLPVRYWTSTNLLICSGGSTTGQRIPDAASLVLTKEKNHSPLLTGHFCQCSPESGKLSLLQSIAHPRSTRSLLGALILFCRAVCYLAGQSLACTSDLSHSVPREGLVFAIDQIHRMYLLLNKKLLRKISAKSERN